MSEFLVNLQKFMDMHPFKVFRVVVLVGLFNDYIDLRAPDPTDTNADTFKTLGLGRSMREGELSPSALAEYMKKYITEIKRIVGDVGVVITTPMTVDCARYVAKKAYNDTSADVVFKLPAHLRAEMNWVTECFEKHIRVNVLRILRETFPSDVIIKMDTWWKDNLVKGSDGNLKLPLGYNYPKIELHGKTLLNMATNDGLHPSTAYSIHFLVYLQKHLKFLRNIWRDCDRASPDKKCKISCQKMDSPYPSGFCLHWKKQYFKTFPVARPLVSSSPIESGASSEQAIALPVPSRTVGCTESVNIEEKLTSESSEFDSADKYIHDDLITPISLIEPCSFTALQSVPSARSKVENDVLEHTFSSFVNVSPVPEFRVHHDKIGAGVNTLNESPSSISPVLMILIEEAINKVGERGLTEIIMKGVFK